MIIDVAIDARISAGDLAGLIKLSSRSALFTYRSQDGNIAASCLGQLIDRLTLVLHHQILLGGKPSWYFWYCEDLVRGGVGVCRTLWEEGGLGGFYPHDPLLFPSEASMSCRCKTKKEQRKAPILASRYPAKGFTSRNFSSILNTTTTNQSPSPFTIHTEPSIFKQKPTQTPFLTCWDKWASVLNGSYCPRKIRRNSSTHLCPSNHALPAVRKHLSNGFYH